ncbi:MAG TPA: mechanosensitive ion channel domain-containing protein [Candidatus Dormibacteraeota bacterium]|jgi:small-conductance mechanosensitive channel|nr:mechanosensitive ion channel domain-containing protein [Candidatus Dormibacteraeota bacterium]
MATGLSLASYAWQDIRITVLSTAILVGAIVVGLLAQFLLYALWQRLVHKKLGSFPLILLQNTKIPSRYIFPLLALIAAISFTPLSERVIGYVQRGLNLCLIAAIGWAFIIGIQVIAGLLTFRYSIEVEDNLHARRIRTQTLVIQRVAVVLVIAVTLAVMLMTFPNARQIGTSIFASAGVAGLIVGMAARSTFAGVIAGLQVALTQPIRIDDSVVVEGEWGWIEEIETTYVVVRLWDLRRLIVPLTYFIERPFQNWTRTTTEIIGTVFLYVDYSLPVEPVREEFNRILRETKLWNSRTAALQVTDFTENTMQLRAIMSANNSSAAFDLRCFVRERLIAFLQRNYPQSLPTRREQFTVRDPETHFSQK